MQRLGVEQEEGRERERAGDINSPNYRQCRLFRATSETGIEKMSEFTAGRRKILRRILDTKILSPPPSLSEML